MKNILIFIFIIALFGALPYACNKTADQNATTTSASADDQKISSAVKEKIDNDNNLDSAKIDVDTDNAVVNLNGTVESRAQEEQAIVIAQNVPGVRTVRSHLKVEVSEGAGGAGSQGDEYGEQNLSERTKETGEKVKEAVSDAGITTKVKMKFAEDPQVSALNIDVTTKDGVVSLKGNVNSKSEADRAIELTHSIDGVRSVQSDLVVKSNS